MLFIDFIVSSFDYRHTVNKSYLYLNKQPCEYVLITAKTKSRRGKKWISARLKFPLMILVILS